MRVVVDAVAHRAFHGVEVVIDGRRHLRHVAARLDRAPFVAEARDVGGDVVAACGERRGAHDVTGTGGRARIVRADVGQKISQALAFAFVFDAARECDARLVRHEHHQAAGQRDVRGEARALLADRVFDDLHQHGFAFVHALRDAGLIHEAWQVGEATCFARGEEACLFQPQVDEGCLHAGQHALHAAEHDVAEQAMAVTAFAAALGRAFDEEFA